MDKPPEARNDQVQVPYVVLISGTHVTGKETLAVRIAEALWCPWLKGEMSHNLATFGARAQERRGYNYDEVYGRIWTSKLQRLVPSTGPRGAALVHHNDEDPGVAALSYCSAVITCYAMRRPARDAIRHAMQKQGFKAVFAVLQISSQTLSGRTLGAEEPELARQIMANKVADIELPEEDEKSDLFTLNESNDVDGLFAEAMEGIQRLNLQGVAKCV